MNEASPNERVVDDILAFNKLLLTLSDAGLPCAVKCGEDKGSLSETLTHIDARLTIQLAAGKSFEQAMLQESELPPQYRAALTLWIHGGQSIEALNVLYDEAQGRQDVEADVRYSLMQPLIILGLVYCGFIYLILATAPRLEAIYAQIAQPVSASLTVLTFARHWLPYWGPIVPLAILVAIVIWKRSAIHWNFHWVPGRTKIIESLRKANYAETIAQLIAKDHSLGQSLGIVKPLIGESIGSEACQSATDRIIEAERQQVPAAIDDPALRALPSMLRWALTSDVDVVARASLLRFAARTYRDSANQSSLRRQNWLPIVCGALFGGTLVLGFSLSLFVPMVELLKTLTRK